MSLIESRSMSVFNLHNGHGSGSELSDANSCSDLDVDMEEVHDIVDNGKWKFKCEYIEGKKCVKLLLVDSY